MPFPGQYVPDAAERQMLCGASRFRGRLRLAARRLEVLAPVRTDDRVAPAPSALVRVRRRARVTHRRGDRAGGRPPLSSTWNAARGSFARRGLAAHYACTPGADLDPGDD